MYAAGEPHPCQVKLLHSTLNDHFKDDPRTPVNTTRMAFVSYYAGPARMRKGQPKKGWTPNKWFGQVEFESATDIGCKTVQYASSVYSYYLATR